MAYNTNNVLVNESDGYVVELKDVKTPMTTAGDIIVGGTNGVPEKLAIGNDGEILTVETVNGVKKPSWKSNSSEKHLYVHHIKIDRTITNALSFEFTFDVLTDSTYPSSFDFNAFWQYLITNKWPINAPRPCSGVVYDASASTTERGVVTYVRHEYYNNTHHLNFKCVTPSGIVIIPTFTAAVSPSGFVDVVEQIF